MMKKWFCLFGLMIALMLCACAVAEETVDVPFVPDGRVQFQPVNDKLKCSSTYDADAGMWNITIHTSQMTEDDWAAVIANGYTGYDVNLFNFYVPTQSYPTGYTFAGMLNMSNDTEEDALEFYLENLEALKNYTSMGYPSGNISLGYFDPDAGVFFPANITKKMYSAFGFRWKEEQTGAMLTEHSLYTVTFDTLPQTIEASIPKVPAGNITPDPRVTGTPSEGKIAYSAEKLEADITLKTLIAPPAAGAKAYRNGREMPVDTAGNAILETELSPGEYAYEDCHIITWETSTATLYQRLIEKITIGEVKRWPEYVDDLEAFTEDNFRYSAYGATKGLVLNDDAFENHAELRLKPDLDQLIKDAAKGVDLTQAGMKLSIIPPADAVYYRNFPSGNPMTIYGEKWVEHSYPLKNNNEAFVQPLPVKGSDLGSRVYGYLAKKEIPLPNGKTTTYYFCDGIKGDLGGLVDMYFWYDKDMNRIGQNYVIHTMDDLPLLASTPLLSKDGDKNKFKGTPFAVAVDSAVDFEEVLLQAARHPVSGHSHYYELKLTNTNGDTVDLDGKEVELYLPFPEGHSENSVAKLKLSIGHYTANHQLIASDVYTLENGKLEITPYGLKIKVKSFSPYVVSWEEPAAPPRTGDDFPMEILMALLSLSFVTVLLMKRRHA